MPAIRDVVIIGGGLTGLAAAHELDRQGITCTLIEVKPRLGGSLASETRDGFVVDAGPMFTTDPPDAPFVAAFELTNEVVLARKTGDGEPLLTFRHGMQTLVNRLAVPLTRAGSPHTLMMRMAVSTLGRMDYLPAPAGQPSRFAICMENGMVLDAKAIIVTAPARYAERIFHTLKPEISYRLLDYRYDAIARVSLGYRQQDVPHIPAEPPTDYPISYLYTLDHRLTPERVPPGHVLIQAGIRYDPAKGIPADVVGELAALLGWSLSPVIERVTMWGEADPLMWLDDTHPTTMQTIQHLLPDGIALAGSDYLPTNDRPTLQARISAGQQAAQQISAWLRSAHP